MANHSLFFRDAGGRLISPESAPFPDEARILRAACIALRAEVIQDSSGEARLDERLKREQQPTGPALQHRIA
jgi:hypothetical protein